MAAPSDAVTDAGAGAGGVAGAADYRVAVVANFTDARIEYSIAACFVTLAGSGTTVSVERIAVVADFHGARVDLGVGVVDRGPEREQHGDVRGDRRIAVVGAAAAISLEHGSKL